MPRLTDEPRDAVRGHALEHRPVRVGVRREEGPRDELGADLGPGDLQEPHEALVVDSGDRRHAVVRRLGEREPAVRRQRRADLFRALGHLVGGHLDAHERLGRDVVGEMARGIDDLHQPPSPTDRIAAATWSGR